MDTKLESVVCTIERLSVEEQDPPVRDFFNSLSKISDDPLVRQIITNILSERPDITDIHLAYLLYGSLQYLTEFSYDKPTAPERILSDLSSNTEEIIELCQSRNVGTNIIERYLHLQIILEMVDHSVTLVDLGSSVGLGLKSINSDWSEVSLHPQLSTYMTGRASVDRFICVDEQAPDQQWLKACYLPEQQEYRSQVESASQWDTNSQLEFHQADAVALPDVLDDPVDIVWTSSMMYQLEYKRDRVETAIKTALNSEGMWVEATKYWSPVGSEYNQEKSYASIVRSKDDWVTPLEVLLSPDDSVSEVRPGADFTTFESLVSESSEANE